jgi:hypothetical protein
MSAIRVTGTLLRHAHTATGTDGSAWVVVDLSQGAHSAVCHARHLCGQGTAAQFAAANAVHHLKRGAQVTVHASGYDVRNTPTPHLLLLGVDLIEQLSLQPCRAAAPEKEHA